MSFTYFIADLHLSADRPDITECLMRFLKEDAINADALYVLGDLFEVWIGDDNVTPFNTAIASAFKAVSQHCPIYFIHGNRDFAIREKWLSKAGMTLLNEQEVQLRKKYDCKFWTYSYYYPIYEFDPIPDIKYEHENTYAIPPLSPFNRYNQPPPQQ